MAKVYIAGPMTGYPYFNFSLFDEMRDDLTQLGHKPISPADLDRAYGFDPYQYPELADPSNNGGKWLAEAKFSLPEAIRRDVDAILQCDWMVMLPGWENSRGAQSEKAVAEWAGLVILYPEDPIPPTQKVLDSSVCCNRR